MVEPVAAVREVAEAEPEQVAAAPAPPLVARELGPAVELAESATVELVMETWEVAGAECRQIREFEGR